MEKQNQKECNPAALAEAILLDSRRLPADIAEDLQTLQQMLHDAVAGEDGTEIPEPVPPVYGKTAVPEYDGNQARLVLRKDETVVYPERMVDLSARKEGRQCSVCGTVTVPQVIRQEDSHG